MGTENAKAHRNKAIYNAKPEQIKSRTEQNKARRIATEAGLVKKGDDRQVNHKTPLGKGGKTTMSNLEVVSEAENKSWRKKHPTMYGK